MSASPSESESEQNSIVKNRSALREFIASIATIRGDLSNITAPPFVLDTKSAVELPSFWAERPSIFVAPTTSSSPAIRALLVLKWFLLSLRNQQYAGRDPRTGVKKPLNAFLGELFIARWEDECGITCLVSEQVSHHPPVTACRVWNEQAGISAEGFTRQEITFSGSVNIRQIGYAVLTLEKWEERYLVPLPNVRVSGILSGTPYPELKGTYVIPSTSGYRSEMTFEGRGFFGSSDKKHSFEAKLYKEGEEETVLWTLAGNWDKEFVVKDRTTGEEETINVTETPVTALQTENEEDMDVWETRKAWKGIREALNAGDMQRTSDCKSVIEQGQREMRKTEEREGRIWERKFFKDVKRDEAAEQLGAKIGHRIDAKDTAGIWAFDEQAWTERKKPYHGDLRPDNKTKRKSEDKSQPTKEVVDNDIAASNTNSQPEDRHGSQGESEMTRASSEVNGTVHPPLPAKIQQQENEQTKLEAGVGSLTLEEQKVVEDMLRSQYSSQ